MLITIYSLKRGFFQYCNASLQFLHSPLKSLDSRTQCVLNEIHDIGPCNCIDRFEFSGFVVSMALYWQLLDQTAAVAIVRKLVHDLDGLLCAIMRFPRSRRQPNTGSLRRKSQ